MKKLFCLAVGVFLILSAGVASAGPLLDDMLKRGELVIGITGDQPPLNVMSKEGEVIGFDADLAKAIARSMNLKARFSRMPFSELLPALQAGKVDMIVSGMTMTMERNTKVAFIGPYYVSGKGILLKRKSVEMLKTEGLNSEKFRVATLKGSTSQAIIEKAAPKAALNLADSYDKAIDLLLQDKADAVIADFPFCAYMADRLSDKDLVVAETKLSFEPLGFAVREDPLLLNGLENFLRILVMSGEMKELQDRWFNSRSWFKQVP
jgi:polar amino acid transport system substrate-binding protein